MQRGRGSRCLLDSERLSNPRKGRAVLDLSRRTTDYAIAQDGRGARLFAVALDSGSARVPATHEGSTVDLDEQRPTPSEVTDHREVTSPASGRMELVLPLERNPRLRQ